MDCILAIFFLCLPAECVLVIEVTPLRQSVFTRLPQKLLQDCVLIALGPWDIRHDERQIPLDAVTATLSNRTVEI